MKKVMSFVSAMPMLVMCVFLMEACSGMNISQNKEEFCVVIHQDTESAIYGVRCEYYLDDTPIGGTEAMIMENGNVIPIARRRRPFSFYQAGLSGKCGSKYIIG